MKWALLIPFLLLGAALLADVPHRLPPLAQQYHDTAARVIGAALVDRTAWERLVYLCDHYPRRLSGSVELEGAIEWARAQMERDGLDPVRTEAVMVPHWIRGRESAEIVAPVSHPLVMLGLGGSVGTPPEGITADVVVVSSFEELDRLGAKVRGKIVLFNAPYTTYAQTVIHRTQGASRAARHGALAALVRSVGPTSLRTPHTGSVKYADEIVCIPAAAVTIEDAELMRRMQERGEPVRVRLKMEAEMRDDSPSANVIGELRGREKPEEIVLVGGHLDSWDVGHGANDDGGGCIATWEAVRLLHRLGLKPRRTIRVVLFTNEENGLRGATGYRDAHLTEMKRHLVAIESDSGIARPYGFGVTANPKALATAREIATLLDGIGAGRITEGGGGADVGPLGAEGVPTMGLSVDMSRYFDVHHTPADTVEKIDPAELARCVATVAVMAYVVADMPARLGE
jgi:carboxypeptidase Q